MVWALLLLCPFLERWQLKETGLFEVPFYAVSEQFDFFLLDKSEKTVLHYNKDGKRLANVSGPGQGPEHLEKPISLRCINHRLLIFDRSFVRIFFLDGRFEKRLAYPTLFGVEPVAGGWVSLFGEEESARDRPTRLLRWDPEIKHSIELGSWPSENSRSPQKWGPDGVIYLNPVASLNNLVSSKDGKYLILKMAGLDKIEIFDMTKNTLIRTISPQGPLIPFDEAWGERELKRIKAKLPMAQTVTFRPLYPEYFPKILSWQLTYDQRLVIWPTSFDIDSEMVPGKPMAFSLDGTPVAPSVLDAHAGRVLAVDGQHAYLRTITDPDEEYTVVRVPVDEALAYLESHPMPVRYWGIEL